MLLAHVIGAAGFLFVALAWKIARGAVMGWMHVVAMQPTVVFVRETFLVGIMRPLVFVVVVATGNM